MIVTPPRRRKRADAQNNRERILAAAREVFADRGPDAPLELIAERAGVGIATLYRHFVNRSTLIRMVLLDLADRLTLVIDAAAAEQADPFDALTRVMREAVRLRIGAVTPTLVTSLAGDPEIVAVRAGVIDRLEGLLTAAQDAGSLRPDIGFGDVFLPLIRLGRPLPRPLRELVGEALVERELEVVLAGLRARPDSPPCPLSAVPLAAADLRRALAAHGYPASPDPNPDAAAVSASDRATTTP